LILLATEKTDDASGIATASSGATDQRQPCHRCAADRARIAEHSGLPER